MLRENTFGNSPCHIALVRILNEYSDKRELRYIGRNIAKLNTMLRNIYHSNLSKENKINSTGLYVDKAISHIKEYEMFSCMPVQTHLECVFKASKKKYLKKLSR